VRIFLEICGRGFALRINDLELETMCRLLFQVKYFKGGFHNSSGWTWRASFDDDHSFVEYQREKKGKRTGGWRITGPLVRFSAS
jgi:hypothetical protein